MQTWAIRTFAKTLKVIRCLELVPMTPRQSIAHYRITSKVGERGMGAVYRATDTKLKSPERNKLETPFGELIVAGGGLMAARTDGLGTLARTFLPECVACSRSPAPQGDQRRRQPLVSQSRCGIEAGGQTGPSLSLSHLSLL